MELLPAGAFLDQVGVDCASKLDGDFAFVILDEDTGECARESSPTHHNTQLQDNSVFP